jgi:PKD repeat protein
MGEMPRAMGVWAFVVLLLALLVAPAGAGAQSPAYDFSVNPNPPNQGQEVTFTLTPTSAGVERVRWDLDGDGDFDDGSTRVVRRTYANRGPVTVQMRAREERGDPFQVVTKTIVVNGPPEADFSFAPAAPLAGEAVSFTSSVSDDEKDAVTLGWRFGDGETATGPSPSHAYDSPGSYSVVLTATDEHGLVATRERTVTVKADPGPVPRFGYTPQSPLTGELVTFTSTSSASQGAITDTDWDLDGDGEFDDASGGEVTWAFTSAGDQLVRMRVTQANGRQAVAFATVEVAESPAAPPPDGEPSPAPTGESTGAPAGSVLPLTPILPGSPARRLVLMRPFPIVRIAGVVLSDGALIRILSVRVPRGARVQVRCLGRGCPAKALARTSARRLMRFRRFERKLPAGVRLELFVRQAGRIGKYTRFLIRGGKPPARMDRCLVPGKRRPVRCP